MALKSFHAKEPILACYFANQKQMYFARNRLEQTGLRVYEGDLRPTDRYLMERFIKGSVRLIGEVQEHAGYGVMVNPRLIAQAYEPRLSVVSIDIETSYSEQKLYSIAVYAADISLVFMVGDEVDNDLVRFYASEQLVIEGFLAWLADYDPDVLIGWSVVAFDLTFLQARCDALKIPFRTGIFNASQRA